MDVDNPPFPEGTHHSTFPCPCQVPHEVGSWCFDAPCPECFPAAFPSRFWVGVPEVVKTESWKPTADSRKLKAESRKLKAENLALQPGRDSLIALGGGSAGYQVSNHRWAILTSIWSPAAMGWASGAKQNRFVLQGAGYHCRDRMVLKLVWMHTWRPTSQLDKLLSTFNCAKRLVLKKKSSGDNTQVFLEYLLFSWGVSFHDIHPSVQGKEWSGFWVSGQACLHGDFQKTRTTVRPPPLKTQSVFPLGLVVYTSGLLLDREEKLNGEGDPPGLFLWVFTESSVRVCHVSMVCLFRSLGEDGGLLVLDRLVKTVKDWVNRHTLLRFPAFLLNGPS